MTGRTLLILREHAEWNTVQDLLGLYHTLKDMGFDPDDMDYRELAQTCHNMKLVNGEYIWDLFYTREDYESQNQ